MPRKDFKWLESVITKKLVPMLGSVDVELGTGVGQLLCFRSNYVGFIPAWQLHFYGVLRSITVSRFEEGHKRNGPLPLARRLLSIHKSASDNHLPPRIGYIFWTKADYGERGFSAVTSHYKTADFLSDCPETELMVVDLAAQGLTNK